MSLLIKGMDMPKDNQQHDINLFNTADGFWADEYRFENYDSKYKTRLLHSVTEIPTPHGRLIDADSLIARLEGTTEIAHKLDYDTFTHILSLVKHRPTIIEAEEK